MLKKIVHIQGDIYYSPSHNTFFREEDDILLEISGHEETIFEFLLCNYNNYVTREELENEFPNYTEPYNKILDRLRREKIENKLKIYGLIKKSSGKVILYLSESPFETIEPNNKPNIEEPILCKKNYYVDYDKILFDFQTNDPSKSILYQWIKEVGKLNKYDEKCIFILERLAFLPTFGGKTNDKIWFIKEIQKIVYGFEDTDVDKYNGTELLLLVRNVVLCIVDYLQIQIEKQALESNNDKLYRNLQNLVRKFQSISIPDNTSINPLILICYHDYLGLAYFNSYRISQDYSQLSLAIKSFELSSLYVHKIDMHLQVWAAFIDFNLARAYTELDDTVNAFKYYNIAVTLRQGLVDSPFFSDVVKHYLFFEYILAKIYLIDASCKLGKFSKDDAHKEYLFINDEFKTNYYDVNDESNESNQSAIDKMLQDRLQNSI